VGTLARILEPEKKSRATKPVRRKAEEIGFTAYGLTKDLDDPLAKAVHALLDHAVESDRRFAELVRRLEAAGIALSDLPGEDQGFDPQRVSRWVE